MGKEEEAGAVIVQGWRRGRKEEKIRETAWEQEGKQDIERD